MMEGTDSTAANADSFSYNTSTMTSWWRSLCCICDDKSDKRKFSTLYESSRRPKTSRKKSSKNTWARRSLLDNEHFDLDEISGEQIIAYQMRPLNTPTGSVAERADSDTKVRERIMEHIAPAKRPPVQNVFGKPENEIPNVRTTFPWMDEKFVPNSRNGTRLGISSIQMNAKRNGKLGHHTYVHQNTRKDHPHAYSPYTKSKSFTEGQGNKAIPPVHQFQTKPNARNIQNGYIVRNNLATPPKVASNVQRPVLGMSRNVEEKPMVLKAPTSSDVGVRKIYSNPAHPPRQERIPRLEDCAALDDNKISTPGNIIGGNSRPSVLDIFPKTQSMVSDKDEVDTNVSFSSEIMFRKQPSEHSGSEVSLKRSAAPGMFTSNKYERLKPERAKSQSSKQDKSKSKNSNASESMYGYVPKVVQNVYASNALEGTKIDDFFMQRANERQLENFGSFDTKTKAVDMNASEPVIITTLVESVEDLTITDKDTNDNSHTSDAGNRKSSVVDDKAGSETPQSSIVKSTKTDIVSPVTMTTTTKEESQSQTTTSENEDSVIMIDYPPNLSNNKIRAFNCLNVPTKGIASTTASLKSDVTGDVLY